MPTSSDHEAIVRRFIGCINAHDFRAIVALCTPDHCLIDSLGAVVSGKSELTGAWSAYFALFPDYRIELRSLVSDGQLVLLDGWASGTRAFSNQPWRIPAAWRAVVRDGGLAEWQVYADNKPVYDILDDGA